MHRNKQKQPENPGLAKYIIKVKGKLTENWADLFNGVSIKVMNDSEQGTLTLLTCRVQDQAELTGILNWIQNMNLVLLEVKAVQEEINNV